MLGDLCDDSHLPGQFQIKTGYDKKPAPRQVDLAVADGKAITNRVQSDYCPSGRAVKYLPTIYH